MSKSRARVHFLSYMRALERAQEHHLAVTGESTRPFDRAPIFLVPSASEPGIVHSVVWVARDSAGNGGSLICDCYGAWKGNYCMHRACVRAYLMSQSKMPA
jgi:hypothetical protein